MKSSLSRSQLGVYYASMAADGNRNNYQIPFLFTLPQGTDMERLRRAVYDALCAHPYLASHIVMGNDGQPLMESGSIGTHGIGIRRRAHHRSQRLCFGSPVARWATTT